jgi:hypothetical protein
MSLRIRRLVVVSLAAVAVAAGGATAASASVPERPAHAVADPGPDFDGHHGSRHDRPLRFGPFEFPRSGAISGGFTWDMRR